MYIHVPSFLGFAPFSQEKCRNTGQVARSICILDHLPAGLGDAMSAQIIIPGPQANKRSDVYVMVLTKQLEVCPGHLILAIVSTRIDNPGSADPFAECAPGFALLGDIKVRRIKDDVIFFAYYTILGRERWCIFKIFATNITLIPLSFVLSLSLFLFFVILVLNNRSASTRWRTPLSRLAAGSKTAASFPRPTTSRPTSSPLLKTSWTSTSASLALRWTSALTRRFLNLATTRQRRRLATISEVVLLEGGPRRA